MYSHCVLLTIFSMATLFSSLIVIIISRIIKSIGLCCSVFDWMCLSQTSNSCFDRIRVRDTQPKTSRWFLWMLDRVVDSSSGHFKQDRKFSIISRNLTASSVLNFKMNFVKHGSNCCYKNNHLKRKLQKIRIMDVNESIYGIRCIGFDVANDFLTNLRMNAGAQAHITKCVNGFLGQ